MKKVTLFFFLTAVGGLAAQAQNVGIGTTTPTGPLVVVANDTGRGVVQKKGAVEAGFYTFNNTAYVQTWSPHDLYFATNNGGPKISIINSSGFVGINIGTPLAQLDVNGTLRIRGNGATTGNVLTSDANGNATWQAPSGGAQVGFRGVINTDIAVTQAAGEAQLTGFTAEFNDGNGFNGAAGTFTAPSAGVYQFVVNLNWYQSTNTTGTSIIIARLYKNNSDFLEQTNNIFTNNTSYSQLQNITSICKLNAGDVVTVKVDPQVSYTYTITGGGSSAGRFSGAKLY